MKRLEGLTARLIQAAGEPMLPAEILSDDLRSFKRLETWEYRVLASPRASFIWTAIPASLKVLSGSTNPVRGIIRANYPMGILLDTYSFGFALGAPTISGYWQDTRPGHFFPVSSTQLPKKRRGLLGGVFGGLFG